MDGLNNSFFRHLPPRTNVIMERMRTVAFLLCSLVFVVNALAAEHLSLGGPMVPNASANVFVSGDLREADPNEAQKILEKLFPSQGTPVTSQKPASSSADKAEAINARAMRDFQKRWEIHLKNPTSTQPPILYPAKTQQIIESQSPASTAGSKQLERKNPN